MDEIEMFQLPKLQGIEKLIEYVGNKIDKEYYNILL
jgi:hypothetical protein